MLTPAELGFIVHIFQKVSKDTISFASNFRCERKAIMKKEISFEDSGLSLEHWNNVKHLINGNFYQWASAEEVEIIFPYKVLIPSTHDFKTIFAWGNENLKKVWSNNWEKPPYRQYRFLTEEDAIMFKLRFG
jgi:hypothetical protein